MKCVHCGLTPTSDCSDHVQSVARVKVAAKKARDPKQDVSIHPRVVRGRTAHAKVNTAKAPK